MRKTKLILLISLNLLLSNVFGMDSKPVIKVGVGNNCPYFCESTTDPGYIAEIIHKATANSPIEVQLILIPERRITDLLKKGIIDVSVLPSAEIRKDPNLFSLKARLGVHFLALANLEANESIQSFSELKGKKVVFSGGEQHHRVLEQRLKELNKSEQSFVISLTGKNSTKRQKKMLHKKRADFIVADFNVLSFYNIKDSDENMKLNILPSSIGGFTPLVLASRRTDDFIKNFGEAIASYVKDTRRNGELQSILEKYNVSDWKQFY